MPDRLHALAFNALSRALGDVDRFVALSERDKIARRMVALVRAEVTEQFAAAIEQSVCAPGEQCADRFCPDCVRYRQAKADAELVRRIGGAQGRVEYQANGQEG